VASGRRVGRSPIHRRSAALISIRQTIHSPGTFFACFLIFAHRFFAAFNGGPSRGLYAILDATKGRLSESFSRRKSKRKSNRKDRNGIKQLEGYFDG
jgi:hypothetical protein